MHTSVSSLINFSVRCLQLWLSYIKFEEELCTHIFEILFLEKRRAETQMNTIVYRRKHRYYTSISVHI